MKIITPINSNTALHNSGEPLKESIDLFNGNPIPLLLQYHSHSRSCNPSLFLLISMRDFMIYHTIR